MKKYTLTIAFIVSVITTALASTAQASDRPTDLGINQRPLGTGAAFGNICGLSHTSWADPILKVDGRQSMRHQFVGSRTTDVNSFGGNLRGTPTTCNDKSNSSAYWFPDIKYYSRAGSTVLQPTTKARIYYKSGHIDGKGRKFVKPFPPGFRMLGSATGKGPADKATIRWSCKGVPGRTSVAPDRCKATGGRDNPVLRVNVAMPECWDGVRRGKNYNMLNKSPRRAFCPQSHPVQLPMMTFSIDYKLPKNAARQSWRIGVNMGPFDWKGIRSYHFDYINGWRQADQIKLTEDCINGTKRADRAPDRCRDPRQFG